jgi:geranylgeranyl pyrophosphate synthase
MTAGSPGAIVSTSFLEYWERIRLRIQNDFRQWIPELFDGLPEPQLEAVLRSMEAGKRIRGCLVCLTCEALDGDVEAAFPRVVGIECIHAASLIHDDFIDGDAVRRNRPAEWTLQGSRQAVLLGDVMFGTVIHKMAEQSIEEGSLVAKVIATMAKGAYQEHLDRSTFERSASEGRDRSDIYDHIIHLKTGVLFGAAAQLGAIVATASAEVRAQSFRFGARLGEAYQIADDLAEVVNLERLPRSPLSALSAAAPILLRFSPTTPPELLRLTNKNHRGWSKWAEREFPLIKDRMRTEISARCASAISELTDFPENHFTHLLREMPADIIRSMEVADRVRPPSLD